MYDLSPKNIETVSESMRNLEEVPKYGVALPPINFIGASFAKPPLGPTADARSKSVIKNVLVI
jgi:hypothetical protein